MTERIHALRSAVLIIYISINCAVSGQVRPGIEVLRERDFDLLQGKRVALVTNPTGVDRQLRSTIDVLHENTELVALFGPEHGVRGDFTAGDLVGDRVDEETGVPVYSLYGSTRKPTPSMLQGIDVIVYDIQDLGVRSYTYISTLGLVMEAAAENGIEVVVLDRPNPLGGTRVEGPLVEPGFHSFVSQYAIPYIYGLTCGELAMLLNEDGFLAGDRKCRLSVIPMEGWERSMTFDRTGLQWIPTSPHIPDINAAFCYPATGIIGELDPNMIGVGYTLPFQVLVTENADAERLADAMNALGLEGVLFRPIRFKPYYMPKQGVELQGVQIHLTDPGRAVLTEIQFWFLQEARKIDPGFDPFEGKEDRFRMFDMVCGSDLLRLSMMTDFNFRSALDYWRHQAAAFRQRSAKYYLYP